MSDQENQEQQERKTAVEDGEKPRLIEGDPTQLARAEVLKNSQKGQAHEPADADGSTT